MRNAIVPSRRRVLHCCLAIALGSGAAASQANCSASDVHGTWYAAGVAAGPYNDQHDDASFTTYCKLVVNKAGKFSKSSSSCQSSLGASTVEGTIKVNKNCQVTAFPMNVYVNGALLNTYTVDYMMLDKGKTSFVATGNADASPTNGRAQFLWSGAKQ